MKPTPINLFTMSNAQLLDGLRDSVLVDIPLGIQSEDDMKRIEYLLGKLANDYTYVITLGGYAKNYVRQLKRQGKEYQTEYEDMMDKRDTLEGIASAIKIQYQAVSRMLTVRIQQREEMDMHEYRKDTNQFKQ